MVSSPPAALRSAAALCAALLGVGLLGCDRPGPALIGYAFPYTRAAVVQLAQESAAALPGSRAIRIVEDTAPGGDRADLEVARARRMVALPGLVGVVGHAGSRGALAAAPVYNDAEVVHIAPLATSRHLASAGPWTFALAPSDSVEGEFIAEFAAERLGAREAALFYVGDEYGEGLRDAVVSALDARGIRINREFLYDAGSDLETLVQAALQPRVPDVVIVAGRQTATAEIARHMSRYAPGIPIIAGDGALRLPVLAERAGQAAELLYVVSFWQPDTTDARYRAFAGRYSQLTGDTPNPSDVITYDALMLLATAAAEAGANPAAMRRWLLSLGESRPAYEGVTGPLTLERTGWPLTMVRIVDGRAQPVPTP